METLRDLAADRNRSPRVARLVHDDVSQRALRQTPRRATRLYRSYPSLSVPCLRSTIASFQIVEAMVNQIWFTEMKWQSRQTFILIFPAIWGRDRLFFSTPAWKSSGSSRPLRPYFMSCGPVFAGARPGNGFRPWTDSSLANDRVTSVKIVLMDGVDTVTLLLAVFGLTSRTSGDGPHAGDQVHVVK